MIWYISKEKMNDGWMWRRQGTNKTCQYVLLYKMYKNSVQVPQPLLIHTDQPPVACNDQLIKLLASLWDVFFFAKFVHQFEKKKKHVPFCWDNHFDYGLRQSLYMKSHQIIDIECEYC